ncbi:IPCS1 [Symbiodinium natans]|uniref:IPCS1 protein n=1 Tax=Symbiodinium natans TaxID=878477 RepID=A0A812MEG6_9DINO|nr:IPCS1 [Symbiodinium natans]
MRGKSATGRKWEQDGRALQCADDELKRDRKFLLKALANRPQALDFVHQSLRFDPELVKIALGQEYHPPKSPTSPKERAQSPGFAPKPKPRTRRSRRAMSLERMERERQRKVQQALELAKQRPHSAPEEGADELRPEPASEPPEG